MGKFNFNESDFSLDKVVEKSEPKTASVEVKTETAESTKGKKGKKMPMMNMRFTEANYDYLKRESRVRGMSASGFLNWMIESYRSDPKHVNYNNDFEENKGW